MNSIPQQGISIDEFDYNLPDSRIAQHPVGNRTESKLLVYRHGEISHDTFGNLNQHLVKKSQLVFNNTKVIPARIFFTRPTGAVIQVFLLQPDMPMEQALQDSTGRATWECLVGNAKKWKGDELHLSFEYRGQALVLKAALSQRNPFVVQFAWQKGIPLTDILDHIGKMPLPPYIKRESDIDDTRTYQTVYARHQGAVAAPTAGLHFTENLIGDLSDVGHSITELTLHVGAGTFKPVETDLVWNHDMHREFYVVKRDEIESLLANTDRIAVGTTSLRTLESLYWAGVKVRQNLDDPFVIDQHMPYTCEQPNLRYEDALEILLANMNKRNINTIQGSSSLMIMPGYKVRSIKALITNFHMPKSTLLLLIGALVGPSWRKIYEEALRTEYRFLSYGDSSILYNEMY